jgi:dihydrofolate reductase
MRFVGIAIVASNGVIGDGERQPFEIAEDWDRFRAVTSGHVLVMGRRTHEAIGRWLPGRTTVVVTSTPGALALPGDDLATGYVVGSVAEALDLAASLDDEVFVAGGGTVYAQSWDRLTDLDLTEVDQAAEGSVRLPEVDPEEWVEVSREPRDGFAFVHYRRR